MPVPTRGLAKLGLSTLTLLSMFSKSGSSAWMLPLSRRLQTSASVLAMLAATALVLAWAVNLRPDASDLSTATALVIFAVVMSAAGLLRRVLAQQDAALEEVREVEECFRLFAENVQDVFWVVDIERERPIFASPSWERLTGLPVVALYRHPKRMIELVHPADRERFCQHLMHWEWSAADEPAELEFRIVRPDGELRWVQQRSVALRDARGRVTRISGIVSDITSRKQMEANLRASEARFRTLSESSPIAIFRTDLDHRFIDFNARLSELCATETAQLAEASLLDVIHPDDHAAVRIACQQTSRESACECRLRGPQGLVRTVLMRVVSERNAEGEQVGYIGTLHDLTEHREVQSRLLMSERLASLGTLAAGVGHEINNPLTYLICNLELARRHLQEIPAPACVGERIQKSVQLLDVALEGGFRIRDIVSELRVFARSETDSVAAVDVNACVETALNIAHNQVKHRARVVKSLGALPKVRANEARLGQVFLNLIVNAAQAMPEGGASQNQLSITTYMDERNAQAVIEVTDTGSGIAPEQLSRIFEPFFTTKKDAEGTGLGLFLSDQTIRSYGGHITVESQLGHGSTFRVCLPSAEALPEDAPSAASGDEQTSSRAKVLVVDDEREVGLAVAALLEGEHDVVTAQDGSHALSLLKSDAYDLILCDLMMPTMSAPEFYAELERTAPAIASRVCFMTGGVFTDSTRAFLERAGRPLLHKPFSLAGLRKLVAQALAA